MEGQSLRAQQTRRHRLRLAAAGRVARQAGSGATPSVCVPRCSQPAGAAASATAAEPLLLPTPRGGSACAAGRPGCAPRLASPPTGVASKIKTICPHRRTRVNFASPWPVGGARSGQCGSMASRSPGQDQDERGRRGSPRHAPRARGWRLSGWRRTADSMGGAPRSLDRRREPELAVRRRSRRKE